MFLTLEDYLAYFPKIEISREDFVKKFVITYSNSPTLEDLFNFKSVIKTPDDPRYINRDKIINYFYDVIIVNRHKYLTEFYKSYFELPDFYALKWDHIDISKPMVVNFNDPQLISAWGRYQNQPELYRGSMLNEFNRLIDQPLFGLSLQKNDYSRKIVRNLNYLDILHHTKVTNTCKSKTSFWETLINVYNDLRLEDRFFAPSSIGLFLKQKNDTDDINYNNFFYLFQQYQPKASILNPFTINWILKNILPGKKILTPVLSWDSYVIAFMHSDFEHYVGIDVMPSVCERAKFLFSYYQNELKPHLKSKIEVDRLNHKKLDIYCQPSEMILNDIHFIDQYHEYFDTILLSSPYFKMELYQSSNQSTDLYPDYKDWLEKYWEGTVRGCIHALAPNGRFGFIINSYTSLKKDEYPLIQDLNMVALKYFKLVGVYSLLNRVSPLRVNKKGRTEMLFVYEKAPKLPFAPPQKIKLTIKKH